MRTHYYTDYADHCARHYLGHADAKPPENTPDCANWQAAHDAYKELGTEQMTVVALYYADRGADTRIRLKRTSEETGVSVTDVTRILEKFRRLVAEKRGLVRGKETNGKF